MTKWIEPTKCLKCGYELPVFRTPRSIKQFLFGGWTCPKCGTELDRKGKPRKK